MAKEKTILINMRIPVSILNKFDAEVEADSTVNSRTAKIVQMMDSEATKMEKKRNSKEV